MSQDSGLDELQTEPSWLQMTFNESYSTERLQVSAIEREKRLDKAMKRLERLDGVDDIIERFMQLRTHIDNCKILGLKLDTQRFNAAFHGNPGTGTMFMAPLYASLLEGWGVFDITEPGEKPVAVALDSIIFSCRKDDWAGPGQFQKVLARVLGDKVSSGNLILILDGAMELESSSFLSSGGSRSMNPDESADRALNLFSGDSSPMLSPLDTVIKTMDKWPSNLIVVLTGGTRPEEFFEMHAELRERFRYTFHPPDLGEHNLHNLFQEHVDEVYKGRCKPEEGFDGRIVRAAIRRLARQSGRLGFKCKLETAVYDLLATIQDRQAQRLSKLQSATISERLELRREDILGPDPSNVRCDSVSRRELSQMVGLQQVKNKVEILFDMIEENFQRELDEKKPLEMSLNRVFVGPPGTGKTTVAKLYAQILVDLGLLSNGEVVMKTPADFIGKYIGQSESKTKEILASTVGKVLVIDEAYMLNPYSTGASSACPFRTAILNILVAEVQGLPGDDRCVILLGYEEKLDELFANGNRGLAGRFMADYPFRFENFNAKELRQILEMELKARDLKATDAALDAAVRVLQEAKNKSEDFSNAREVKNLVSRAVMNYLVRQRNAKQDNKRDRTLVASDFDQPDGAVVRRKEKTPPNSNMYM
ncbi:P-loop containing nucleoside triphosphate hydrolase protein [Podospora aff. communis PSN243]|uniref:P-loop containing nucleoside triphosphate hydrolase protein n=1 Tax=Podospora aff. communis PSN243 TaxID=3040156 RepID=A0AAV9GTB3_9PEZI|nr:P-loop containing nucleoside triphosphate hydrolase protein [Podospora aff. communis PSN243]